MTCDASNSSHLQALYQGSSAVLLSPFDGKALVNAVSELMRVTDTTLTLGALSLDVEKRHATLDGRDLTLTAQEFAIPGCGGFPGATAAHGMGIPGHWRNPHGGCAYPAAAAENWLQLH